MRLEQLHVLYHENLCGWNSYYTTRTCVVGRTIIPREPGYLDDLDGRFALVLGVGQFALIR